MDTLIIEKKNEVYITVDCDPNVQRELSEFFTFYVPGYKFMPAFRNRMWDGKIRLFSQKTKEIYFGLYPYIKAFADERGYHVVCGKNVEINNRVDKEIVKKFANSLGQNFEARDYQIDAIYHSLKFNRTLLLSPTASGKSFIIYALIRYYTHLLKDEENSRYPVARPQIADMRQWAAVIEVADHFLGCDSMGQHMARALDKTATVVIGSTYPENISYPGHKDFDIIDVGDGRREYAPIRITQDERVDRYNDQSMELDKNQIKQIVDSCRKRLGKPKAFTGTYVPVQQESGSCSTPPTVACQVPMQPQKQDAFQIAGGEKRQPLGTTPMNTGAPKPTFTLNKPKPKQNKGFKNLLKSDKPTIDIEKK